MKSILRIAGILLSSLAISQAATLKVTSFSTITTDLAKNIGGTNVDLIPIVKPGVDPHEFEPSPSDVKEVSESDLVLLTGKGIEGYLTKLQESAPKATFVDCGKAFPSLRMVDDGKEIEDPHWWHSIANVEKATEVIKNALIKADPDHAKEYETNAATYLGKLADLDTWAKEKIATLPRDRRKLVTSHDAFQYFARDFGFKIYSIEGVSTEDEPSSKKVADLIQTIKDQGVKAVFFENIENPKVIAAITRETGAKIGGELYADGLGDKEATTYIDMMKHNVTTIVESLQ
ncbi:MAG TPA: metal ABC transporter substrate-binding protein [Verrucomicrobiae bacterium]|nr:metal ABC transporter substrate-binding protein [Verrucomicrobiae bacterium]